MANQGFSLITYFPVIIRKRQFLLVFHSFFFIPSIFTDPVSSKSNIYERDRSKFNNQDFILDYFEKDRDSIFNVSRHDIDLAFNNFLMNMNELLDNHAPYRKLNKYKN